jgi:peptidoglycan glycosyltransferase
MMGASDYWARWAKRRLSRRQLLVEAAGLGAGLAGLSLAGCSGKLAGLSVRPQLVQSTLVITIDMGLERALDRAMTDGAHDAGLPDRPPIRGAAVALDTSTGAILALASRPAFSPEELNDPSLWAADEAADRRDGFVGRRLNRVVHGYYPPGSIFKTVTATATLEQGMNPTFDYRSGPKGPRPPDGILQLGAWHRLDLPDGSSITCGNHPPEEDWVLDLTEAFVWSCNVAFAELGIALGPEALVNMARRFGFEQEIVVPGLGSFTSTLDREPDRPIQERFVAQEEGNLARTAFGQGQTLATPLQMALIPAAIANQGTIMQPYIVAGWRDAADGTWIDRVEPQPRFDTSLSPKTLEGLERLMQLSTTYGWASGAKLNELNENPGVAGKTGSAEWSDEIDAAHSWFIGYFPVEHPRIAVAIVVERGGVGPTVAVRIANYFFASEAAATYLKEAAP